MMGFCPLVELTLDFGTLLSHFRLSRWSLTARSPAIRLVGKQSSKHFLKFLISTEEAHHNQDAKQRCNER